jgi:hypothetical protein
MTRKSARPARTADPLEAGAMPWFDKRLHRVESRGIVAIATGDLLAEDGLPVNGAARAQALALKRSVAAVTADPAPIPETTEAPATPAAEQE